MLRHFVLFVPLLFSAVLKTTSTSSGIYASDYETKTTRLVKRLSPRQIDISHLKKLLQADGSLLTKNEKSTNLSSLSSAASYMVAMATRQLFKDDDSWIAVPGKIIINVDETCGREGAVAFNFEFDNDGEQDIHKIYFHVHLSNFQRLPDVPTNFTLKCNNVNNWSSIRPMIDKGRHGWLNFDLDKICLLEKGENSHRKHAKICILRQNPDVEILGDNKRPGNERSFLVIERLKLPVKSDSALIDGDNNGDEAWLFPMPVLPFADSPRAIGLQLARRLFKREAPTITMRRANNICHRETLHINFREIDLNLGILYPTSYSANYCSGECGYPLPRHLAATRHAQWQTTLSKFGPIGNSNNNNFERPPSVSCAPVKYSNKPVLISRHDGTVAYEIFPDMTVEECGCL